jgi:lipoate-protein ligase A
VAAWAVEVRREPPGDLHARPLPAPLERTVWVCEPTAPALVLGSTQRHEVVDAAACAAAGVEVVRRRRGGGAVLVEPGAQLWIDVLLPAGDPLWRDDVGQAFLWLGRAWADALAELGVAARVHEGGLCTTAWSRLVCFGGLGTGEVTDPDGAKLVGISQRRTREGARFQCQALLEWDPERLVALLALSADERAAATSALLGAARAAPCDLGDLRDAVLAQLAAQ